MWDLCHNFIKQPVPEDKSPLLVAGGTASALLAGESNKKLLAAFGATDTGETVSQVAAFEELVDCLANDRTPEPETHTVTLGINLLELVKIIAHQLVEWRQLRISMPVTSGDFYLIL